MRAASMDPRWALGGALVIVILGCMAVLGLRAPDADPVVATAPARADPTPMPPPVRLATAPAAPALPRGCDLDPVLPPQEAGDGRFTLEAALRDPSPPSARAFVAVAKEAASRRYLRDAEVALIAACRIAAAATSGHSVSVADAQARLGALYAASASTAGAEGEVPARARQLLADSTQTLNAVLGPQASRTRIAQARLTALDDPEAAAQATRTLGAAPQAAPSAAPELSQLAGDLERLRAQALAVSADPSGFNTREQGAETRRDACRGDAACLRTWYARRRAELLAEF